MESTNCWLGLTIIKGSHLDVWQTNVQLQVIHLQIWIPGLPSWRHCLASATRAWSTPIHSSIPGHCKCSRFIKHFVDSVCADWFHCSRRPTFHSSGCKGFKRLGYYSCGQSNNNFGCASGRIFWAKQTPDLDSVGRNTSKSTPLNLFPRCFWPAKILGKISDTIWPLLIRKWWSKSTV